MNHVNTSAVLYAPQDLRIENHSVPEAGPGQVLVRVEAVGICGSDVHYYEHGRIGDFVLESPMVIGHEAAGTIEAVGDGLPASRVGERVALEPGVPCGACIECRAGRYNLCPDVVFFATPPVDGAIAQFVTIDSGFAHPVPEGVSAEHAAMAEPVSVGVWACRKAGVGVGDRVLITGAGPIGLLAGQVARAFGASRVTVTDLSDDRLGTAAALGLDTCRADAEPDGEFDVLLECSGAAPAFRSGLGQLARAGRAVLIGMGADSFPLDVHVVQGRELSISGIFRYANCYPTSLELIGSGAVNVEALITHRFGLADTEAAMTINRRDPHALKAMVLPNS